MRYVLLALSTACILAGAGLSLRVCIEYFKDRASARSAARIRALRLQTLASMENSLYALEQLPEWTEETRQQYFRLVSRRNGLQRLMRATELTGAHRDGVGSRAGDLPVGRTQ